MLESIPSKLTPALAKANKGRITKDDQGARICSKSCNGVSPFLPFNGIQNPMITPARVACTPDFNTEAHKIVPTTI